MGDSNKSKYYYSKNGDVIGPYSIDSIVELINKNTLVYKEDNDWKIASEFPELKEILEYKSKKKSMVITFLSIITFCIFISLYFIISNSKKENKEDEKSKEFTYNKIDSTNQIPNGRTNDSRRRVCILKSIVGPMILLSEI